MNNHNNRRAGATMNESLLETWIARILKHNRESDMYGKYVCIEAAFVVGRYEEGVTEEIAHRTKRSQSSVQNWAHAARLYQDLRSNGNRKMARHLFRSLPVSHWWLAYDIQQAGYESLYYLLKAFEHSWSGRAMLEEYRKDRDAGTAPLIFRRGVHVIYELANELLMKHNSRLNEDQRVALLGVQDAFAETEAG